MPQRLPLILVMALCLSATRLAIAGTDGGSAVKDGGEVDASTNEASDDAGTGSSEDASTSSGPSPAPLGCDGALCDTSNGAACSVSGGRVGRPADALSPLVLALPIALVLVGRRTRRGTERPARGGRAC